MEADSNRRMEMMIESHLSRAAEMLASLRDVSPAVVLAARLMCDCLSLGDKVLVCGNGGSAAEAQHLTAELIGRFAMDRAGLAAVSLTTDSSSLTAIANDYGFEHVFARQVEALGKPGDVLVAISTSGESANVCEGARAAGEAGLAVVALTGASGGALAELCDVCLPVANDDTPRVQEGHLVLIHLICALVEDALFGDQRAGKA